MADSGSGTKWIKYGCLGCAGLAGVVVLLLGGLVGVAWFSVEEPKIEDRVLTHDVTPVEPAGVTREQLPAGAGKVTLDLANADFEILPGEPGDALRIDAKYDENAFSMEETFERPEVGPWHYTFRFRGKGTGWLAPLRQLFSGSDPEILIYLPPDAPIELAVALEKGGCAVELGGLWLTEADIDAQMGGLMVSVDEPLREPMERLSIQVRMGGAALRDLGNASPRELLIDLSMGGAQLDLRGEWSNDSAVTIRSSRSGGELRLPRDVLIEGIDSRRGIPGDVDPEIRLPTLRFTAETRLDDIEVR